MIISTDTEKYIGQNPKAIHDKKKKNSHQVKNRENYPNLINASYTKTTANNILNGNYHFKIGNTELEISPL